MLRTGFHKAYVDDAAVFHSHQYTLQQRYNFSIEEGKLFSKYFGWSFPSKSRDAYRAEIETLNARDMQYAIANKISYEQLNEQHRLNKATVEGRARGAAIV